jgi:hypothetical protein
MVVEQGLPRMLDSGELMQRLFGIRTYPRALRIDLSNYKKLGAHSSRLPVLLLL